MKEKLFWAFLLLIGLASMNHKAMGINPVELLPIAPATEADLKAGGTFYVVNALTGKLLTRTIGNDYGTHACVADYITPEKSDALYDSYRFTIAYNAINDHYTFYSMGINNRGAVKNGFMRSDAFYGAYVDAADGDDAKWTITATGSGSFSIKNRVYGAEGEYFAPKATDNYSLCNTNISVSTSPDYIDWKFYKASECTSYIDYHRLEVALTNATANKTNYTTYPGYDAFVNALATAQSTYDNATVETDFSSAIAALKRAELTCYLTYHSPTVDITQISITNPGFEKGIAGWTDPSEGLNTTTTYANFTNRFMESWLKNATLPNSDTYQIISNLPEGYYNLSAAVNAVWQSNASLEVSGVELYANDQSTSCNTGDEMPELFEVPLIYVAEGGSLRIGLRITSTNANWVAVDNFKLEYCGNTTYATSTQLGRLGELIDRADVLAGEHIMTERLTLLGQKKSTAQSITAVSVYDDAQAAIDELTDAIASAESSMNAYASLKSVMDRTEEKRDYYIDYPGYTAYEETTNQELGTLNTIYANLTMDETAIDNALTAFATVHNPLEKALRAPANSGTNLTSQITNPDFNAGNATGWTSPGGVQYGTCEFYQSNFDTYQTLTGLPAGTYELNASAFLRPGANDTGAAYQKGTEEIEAYLYASTESGEWKVPLLSLYSETYSSSTGAYNGYPNVRQGADIAFNTEGLYKNNAVKNIQVKDGETLRIGIKMASSKSLTLFWACYDNFTLTEEGNLNTEDHAVTVEGIVDTESLNNILSSEITSVHFATGATVSGEVTPANPNTIFYGLPAGTTLAEGIDAGNAGSITIDEEYPFHAPEGFSATNLSYVRSFSAESHESTASGWQSIVLPFDVTSITATQNGNTVSLEPFATWNSESQSSPFWLYKVIDNDYVAASSIEANTLYLISIPNHSSYAPAFNITGNVTFSGTTVKTTSLHGEYYAGGAYRIESNFAGTKADVYVLDEEGSAWQKGTANSFHGYAIPDSDGINGQILPIFGGTTDIKEVVANTTSADMIFLNSEGGILIKSTKNSQESVYNLNGQLIKKVSIREGNNFIALPCGQYIINGNVISVK